MLDLVRLRVLAAVAQHGSITKAAEQLHYSQPSVSHHIARLEAETGAQLLQRVGRGIRLTETGWLLAARAVEIVGRVDAASAELAAQVGLAAGRIRLAGFSSALSTFVPAAVGALAQRHPGLEVALFDAHATEALQMLRAGQADIAIVFGHEEPSDHDDDVRLVHLLDDPTYLLTTTGATTLSEHRDSDWIAGCERCRQQLIDLCGKAGFVPRIRSSSDDMVVRQALVAARIGVTILPGLALELHSVSGIDAVEIPDAHRHIYAATYGQPPDPPATAALISALVHATRHSQS